MWIHAPSAIDFSIAEASNGVDNTGPWPWTTSCWTAVCWSCDVPSRFRDDPSRYRGCRGASNSTDAKLPGYVWNRFKLCLSNVVIWWCTRKWARNVLYLWNVCQPFTQYRHVSGPCPCARAAIPITIEKRLQNMICNENNLRNISINLTLWWRRISPWNNLSPTTLIQWTYIHWCLISLQLQATR